MSTTICAKGQIRRLRTGDARKLLGVSTGIISLLFLAATGRGDTLAVVTSQAGQNANDSVSWTQLGADGTIVGSNFSVQSANGISVSVGLTGANSIVSVVCSANPSGSCSWNGRNATANDTLLWTSDAANGANGPLTLVFSTGVGGAGAVIQADAPGQFTAQIQAFNGSNSLGSFTLTSDSSGDPLYIGVADQSGANITSVAFNLTNCTDLLGVCNDFALDTVSLSNAGVFLNPNSLTFTGQALNTTSAAQTVTLNNFTSSAVTITNISTSGDFASPSNTCNGSVGANSSCTISVTFTPTSSGTRTGTLAVTDSAANSPQTVALTGGGPASAATLSPSSLTFGGQLVNTTSSSKSVTLSNGGTATLNISNIATTGDFASTNNCNGAVAVNSSCTISVTFTPTATLSRTGTLTVTDDASTSPQSINLSGTGTSPAANLAPNPVTFGSQVVRTTSAAQPVTLQNSGTASLSISSIAVTGDFGQTNNCGSSLAAGSTCAINVTFTPTTTGTRTGTLKVTDNASGSPQSINLTGTGTDPVVTLNPSTSLTFSSQQTGTTSAGQNVTLTNTGTAPLSIGNIVTSGDFAETDNCPNSLPQTSGSNSCTITVTFTPTGTGTRTGSLTISDNAQNSPQSVSLTGTGAAAPAVSLTPTGGLTFSGQLVGTPSAAQAVTVTNSGGGTLTLSGFSITGTNASDFAIASGGTCTTSSSLAANGSCTINVTFKPTATGTRSASVSVSDNASGSPQSLGVSGTGTQAVVSFTGGITFTAQNVGTTSAAQSATLKNTGTGPLTISSISITGTNASDFAIASGGTCSTSSPVAAGGSCTINVTFKPTATGSRSASISVADNAPGSPHTDALNGTGTLPPPTFNPTPISFGNQGQNTTSSAKSTTLTNNGAGPLSISSISITGTNASAFAVASGGTCSTSSAVAAGGTCTINVTFTPTTTGSFTANISVADNATGSPHTVALSGTGVTSPVTFNAPLTFSSQNVGTTSSAQTATLTNNSGSTSLTISSISITGTNASDFAIASGGTCSTSSPVAAGGSCTISVTFKPTATGSRSASISVADNASGSPHTDSLTGTGTLPPPTFSPNPIAFGNQTQNTTSSAKSTTLTNNGAGPLSISSISITGTNASNFAIASGGTCSTSSAVAAGGTCTINVTFTPSSVTSFSANISVADNATGSPHTAGLTGSGTTTTTTLANGVYKVANSAGTLVWDVPGASKNPSVDVDIAASTGGTNQQWTFTAQSNGNYVINNVNSGMDLDDPADSTTAGTKLVQYTAASTATNHQWILTPSGNGYTVKNASSSMFVDAGANTTGTDLVQEPASGASTQVWVITLVPTSSVSLSPNPLTFSSQSVNTTSAAQPITLKNNGTSTVSITSIATSGDFAQTNTCGSSVAAGASCTINVTFKPTALGTRTGTLTVTDNASGSPQTAGLSGTGIALANGVYKVTNSAGTLVWDVPGASKNPSVNVDIAASTGGTNQQWTFTAQSNGNFVINNVNSGLDLDDPAASTTAGTKLVQYTAASTATNHQWILTPSGNGYTIKNATSAMFVDAGANTAGTILVQEPASGLSTQVWVITAVSSSSPGVSLSTTSLTFSSQTVGTTSSAQSVTLTNNGGATLSITSIAASGDFAQTNTCGSSVAAGANCTISVTFKPTATGTRTGTITITDNASGSPQSVSLTGTGVSSSVVLTPTSLAFGSQQVGTTSASKPVTLKNAGSTTLTITAFGRHGTNATDFAETNTCGGSVAAGASCTISITFTPSATGARSGSVSITDSASDSPQSITFTGGGTPANGTYTVTNSAGTLVWDDPGSVKSTGTLVDLFASNGGTNQKWTFTSVGSGYYTITNVNSALALEDPSFSTTSGTKLDQFTSNGGTNQHWFLTVSGSGYTIKCQSSGLLVDASTNTSGTDIVQATASGASTQVWTIH